MSLGQGASSTELPIYPHPKALPLASIELPRSQEIWLPLRVGLQQQLLDLIPPSSESLEMVWKVLIFHASHYFFVQILCTWKIDYFFVSLSENLCKRKICLNRFKPKGVNGSYKIKIFYKQITWIMMLQQEEVPLDSERMSGEVWKE